MRLRFPFRWRTERRAFLVGICVLASGAAIGAALPVAAQAQSSTRLTGKFVVVEIAGLRQPEQLNRMHGLDLRLRDRGGAPVEHADVSISGSRKYAPNELPTVPVITHLGGGAYRLEGLRFHMAGEWTLSLNIRMKETSESLSLDVVVK